MKGETAVNITASGTTSHPAPVYCAHVHSVARIETHLITDLVAALRHLEDAATRAGSPAEEARACRHEVPEELFTSWVRDNAERIRAALDQLTAPYVATSSSVPAP